MKRVSYERRPRSDLVRYASMAPRILRAVAEYAAGEGAHRNRVTQLVGSDQRRLRVGDFRVIFTETEAEIIVTRIAPRGSAYDD